MAAALGTWSALTATKPRRIEGHTSNVEQPILYAQWIKGTIGETTEATDTYIIPHKFTKVYFIKHMPLAALVAATMLNGGEVAAGDDGVFYADSATFAGPTQITTVATAGASTVVLTSVASAANDNLNYCWLDIRYSSGNVQTVQITDYVHATTIATLAEPLTESIAATGSYYTVRGTLMTVPGVAATPTVAFEVIGTFEG
jgi:hypothetical protein